MSIYLRVKSLSAMDWKLEEEWQDEDDTVTIKSWVEYVKGLQFVKDCWYDQFVKETVIEFSNEANKTWFLMRWS